MKAWTIGSNEEFGIYNGEKLALEHDVIVVAGNYRIDVCIHNFLPRTP